MHEITLELISGTAAQPTGVAGAALTVNAPHMLKLHALHSSFRHSDLICHLLPAVVPETAATTSVMT